MCEAARLEPEDRVLEIGTGCGYSAAVLSQLASHVDTVERIAALAEVAGGNLATCGCLNVSVYVGDGTLGLPGQAPFNAIIVTAGATGLPRAYVQQIADGGRIVIPIGADRHSQVMYRFTRRGDRLESEPLGGFAFVPLIGAGPMQPADQGERWT
jgi:protein-L-isoaspartate(D-aspartate) O-methyltransferase